MADNVNITQGDGSGIVAADEIAGIKHQRVKIEHGADGSATDVSTASPLPVELPSAQITTLTPPAAITGFATATNQTTQQTLTGAVTETAPATDTASSGLNGRLQRIAQRITSLIALLPTSLGQKTMANGLAVTLASDQSAIPITDATGATAANQTAANTLIGAVTETAPATDTASSGLNGRLQRIAQRMTSLIALVPASLGQKTKAASFAVTLASDSDALPITDNAGSLTVDSPGIPTALGAANASASMPVTLANDGVASTLLGSVTETAPATDTASSGHSGRLQRIAQRITSLIALLPTSLGQKAMTASLAVVIASDQASIPVASTLQASSATIGKLAANSGVDIGDVDVTSLPIPTVAATTSAAINFAASGDNTVVAGTASQTVRVHKLFLIATSAVNLKFKDGASTDLTPALPLQAGAGIVLDFDREPWFVTTAANAFVVNLSGAAQVSGRIYYTKS